MEEYFNDTDIDEIQDEVYFQEEFPITQQIPVEFIILFGPPCSVCRIIFNLS